MSSVPPNGRDASEVPVIVHIALFATQLTFSGLHVVGKFVLESVHPLALAGLRVVVAAPVLLILAWRHDRIVPGWREMPILAALGLFGVFLNQLLFISGLRLTQATNAAILMPTIPVFAVAVGAFFRVERFGGRKLAGLGLTIAGALMILDPARLQLDPRGMTGDILILTNCLSYAVFLVLQRPALERLPWRTVVAWAFVFGGAGVLAVGWPELRALTSAPVEAPTLAGIAYIVIFPTIIGYALNSWALRRSSPSLAAGYTTLQPLLTAVLAFLFLAEALGWRHAFGFLAIASGLLLAGRKRSGP